jgi:DNA-binding NarL/FixJ family response regulator
VLDLMAVGLDNRAIAAKLGIEYTTVRGHVRSVIEKLRARSRLEAVARAYQRGWVPKP